LGASEEPRVGVVVQRLVHADVAGVLFTCNPVTGLDEIVIEAAWGLGESVVQGMVIPDRIRMTRAGAVLERHAGSKDIAVRRSPDGGTYHEPVPPQLARRICLGYWNGSCLSEIGKPHFWSADDLGPIIARYEAAHPAPAPRPLPLCTTP
jgi:hypothetical protein